MAVKLLHSHSSFLSDHHDASFWKESKLHINQINGSNNSLATMKLRDFHIMLDMKLKYKCFLCLLKIAKCSLWCDDSGWIHGKILAANMHIYISQLCINKCIRMDIEEWKWEMRNGQLKDILHGGLLIKVVHYLFRGCYWDDIRPISMLISTRHEYSCRELLFIR